VPEERERGAKSRACKRHAEAKPPTASEQSHLLRSRAAPRQDDSLGPQPQQARGETSTAAAVAPQIGRHMQQTRRRRRQERDRVPVARRRPQRTVVGGRQERADVRVHSHGQPGGVRSGAPASGGQAHFRRGRAQRGNDPAGAAAPVVPESANPTAADHRAAQQAAQQAHAHGSRLRTSATQGSKQQNENLHQTAFPRDGSFRQAGGGAIAGSLGARKRRPLLGTAQSICTPEHERPHPPPLIARASR
jgi:hypothetical protein